MACQVTCDVDDSLLLVPREASDEAESPLALSLDSEPSDPESSLMVSSVLYTPSEPSSSPPTPPPLLLLLLLLLMSSSRFDGGWGILCIRSVCRERERQKHRFQGKSGRSLETQAHTVETKQ